MHLVQIQTHSLVGKAQTQAQRTQEFDEFHAVAIAQNRVEPFRAGGQPLAEGAQGLLGILEGDGSGVAAFSGAFDLPPRTNARGSLDDRILLREFFVKRIGHAASIRGTFR